MNGVNFSVYSLFPTVAGGISQDLIFDIVTQKHLVFKFFHEVAKRIAIFFQRDFQTLGVDILLGQKFIEFPVQ